MSFNLNLNWTTYWNLVLLITVWNLGFFAITRKGKLLYPILQFFEQKKKVSVLYADEVQKSIADIFTFEIGMALVNGPKTFVLPDSLINEITAKVRVKLDAFLGPDNTFFVYNEFVDIILLMHENKKVAFYCQGTADRFPDLIKDPIVCCITCMASVHGFIHYTIQCLYHGWYWNPLELIVCAVPVAFLGELIWKLKMLIEKKTP